MSWQLHENELPGWASVVKKVILVQQVILVQPSSAASERVFFFSLLHNSFDEKQQNCLEEHPLCYSIIPAKNHSIFQEYFRYFIGRIISKIFGIRE